MPANDMNHLKHLSAVALSDVEILEYKESTYQGSWKRSGGRSAWFMLVRLIDRLQTMMKPKPWPESFGFQDLIEMRYSPGEHVLDRDNVELIIDLATSENIFTKIEEHPDGDDGTVLAVIRDLRRYLLLVEAEMISSDVVSVERPPVSIKVSGEVAKPVPLEDSNKHAERSDTE
jgi:hypothetical protein